MPSGSRTRDLSDRSGPTFGDARDVVIRALVQVSTVVSGIAAASIGMLILTYISNRQFSWVPASSHTVEYAGYLMVALVFWGLPMSFDSGSFIRVMALFSKRLHRPMLVSGHYVAAIIYVAVLAWFATKMTVDSFQKGTVAYGGAQIDKWIPESFMASGILLFLVYLLLKSWQHLRPQRPDDRGADAWTSAVVRTDEDEDAAPSTEEGRA